jgi:hypothetical protein
MHRVVPQKGVQRGWLLKTTFQVEPDHYWTNYDEKRRFCSYWHQIDEITSLKPKNVLEIGIGNGFVSNYLKQRKLAVTTLDLDRRLMPETAGSVLKIPFSDRSFEVTACYEVLEHLPYANFKRAISEISRVTSSHTILSLPDDNPCVAMCLQIRNIGQIKKLFSFPNLRKPTSQEGQHYWEIGQAGYSLKKVVNDIIGIGYSLEKTYRVFEMPSHRLFVLKKILG